MRYAWPVIDLHQLNSSRDCEKKITPDACSDIGQQTPQQSLT